MMFPPPQSLQDLDDAAPAEGGVDFDREARGAAR